MGICYEVILEVCWPRDSWSWISVASFDVGKAYELARCFTQRRWPEGERSRWIPDEGDLPAGGCFWGTYDEIHTAYEREVSAPEARDFAIVQALFAAATAFRARGADVRFVIWGE